MEAARLPQRRHAIPILQHAARLLGACSLYTLRQKQRNVWCPMNLIPDIMRNSLSSYTRNHLLWQYNSVMWLTFHSFLSLPPPFPSSLSLSTSPCLPHHISLSLLFPLCFYTHSHVVLVIPPTNWLRHNLRSSLQTTCARVTFLTSSSQFLTATGRGLRYRRRPLRTSTILMWWVLHSWL